jgi:predicted LPLAT superfamily acyltransferase
MSSWKGKTRGGVLGYTIFIWNLKHLGLSFAYFLLYPVVFYFMFASREAFRSLWKYYRVILEKGRFASLACIYRNYYIFGQVLVDKLAMLSGCKVPFTFDFEGEEYLRQMDKGGFLISGHVGNWEIAGHLLNRLEKRINIILFDAEHQQIKGLLSEALSERKVNFIVIRDDYSHLTAIRDALANGEIIAMHGDRFLEGNKTVTTEFLGHDARFPVGPVNMAARFGVPVSFVFAMKETNKHYHFYATPLETYKFTRNLKEREEILGTAVRKFAGVFENMVRKYPCQWFNYYDFWNSASKR